VSDAPARKTHWSLGAADYAAKPWIDTDLAEKAAKEYAQENGYFGAVGGWIYKESDWSKARRAENPEALRRGSAVTQGWFNFWCSYRRAIEDHFTAKLTAFPTFDAMVHPASPTYRPTILVRDNPRDWRWAFLANAYDVAQKNRGDRRRAHTGYPVVAPVAPAAPAVRPVSLWLSRVVAGASVRG